MSIQWTGAERAMARSAVGPSSLAWEQLSNEERERLLDRIAQAIATSRLSRDHEIAAVEAFVIAHPTEAAEQIARLTRERDALKLIESAALTKITDLTAERDKAKRLADEWADEAQRLIRDRDEAYAVLALAAERFAADDRKGLRLILCDMNARENARAALRGEE